MLPLKRIIRSLRLCALPVTGLLLCSSCAVTEPAGEGGAPESGPAAVRPPAAVSPAIPALKPTVPPQDLDPARRFAWQQVVQLGEAFAAGDVEGFLARVSPGFYRGYSVLETSLRSLMAGSVDRAAVVAVRQVTDDQGRVSVRAEWTRTVTRRDGSVDPRHGLTEFLFLKSDTTLRLLDYRGDPPFAIDGI